MAGGVDVVLRAATEELAPSAFYHQNPRYRLDIRAPGEVAKSIALYDGKERFLVRTALVRHLDFHGGNAPKLDTCRAVAKLCQHIAMMDQEYMVTIAVNSALRLMAIHETAVGGKSGVGPLAADIIKIPFLTGAQAVFLVHNHPSGVPIPSAQDIDMTERAKKATECVGVTLLDHVVVAYEGWTGIITKDQGDFTW
jgi:DNA repair protein RadC